jgi:hypothetical protein
MLFMLSITIKSIMLNVIMLSAISLNVVVLNFIAYLLTNIRLASKCVFFKRSSLLDLFISVEEKKFYNIDLRAQCYKTLYFHNL